MRRVIVGIEKNVQFWVGVLHEFLCTRRSKGFRLVYLTSQPPLQTERRGFRGEVKPGTHGIIHAFKFVLSSLALGLIFLFAAWPSKAQDDGIRVGVVIQGPDGQPQTYCVTLDGEKPTGADAIQATGLDIITESSSRGLTVCRIDSVGCTLPDEHCFCQCEGGSTCAYWSYFRLSEQGNWAFSPVGAAASELSNGDVEGWWWRDSSSLEAEPLPVIPFETICGELPGTFPRTVIDGLGREVVIESPPLRIASVTLGSDEILLSLVGPDRLLGVTYFAEDLAISNISDQLDGISHTDLSGDPEYLISLDADLVILAAYNNPAVLDQLLDAGVPVFVLVEFNTLDEIRANIRLLGQVTGEDRRAEDLIAEMDGRLAAVQEAVAGQEPVRVLYYEPGGITYGPGSTVDEIMTLAGGVNVVAEAGLEAYPLVDSEFVLSADPDVILLGGWFAGQSDPVATFTDDPAFQTLRAVLDGRIVPINDAHMTNVSHYIALGVEDVSRALYPDAFEDKLDD